MKRFLVILLPILIATVYADEGSDQYDYDYYYEDPVPNFTAPPQEFTVEVDDDITFPCDVQHLGSEMLMFRHISPAGDTRMLFLGNMSLKARSKFTKKGNSFVLSGVTRRHAGQYECRIESDTVLQLVHNLNVQYPSTVRRISPDLQRIVKGSSVTLECAADGNPKAAISWSKQNGVLPSGTQSAEGKRLTLKNVDRHAEGTYICTASNGVSPPSSTSMSVQVEYPPEIHTEETVFHRGEGDEVSLTCIVHGRPSPSVSWTKGGRILMSSEEEGFLQEHDGLNEHVLTIQKVQEKDFGEYTCVASNPHGDTQHTVTVTGLPKLPRITSSPAGGERDAYTITWETESNSPITQYRLKYRKVQDNRSAHVPGGWDDRLYFPPTMIPVEPPLPPFMGPIHPMSHPIQDLEPGTDYEASVSVENRFGWSNNSQIFHFHTKKEEPTTTTTTTTTTTSTTTLAPEPENIAPLLEEVAVGHSANEGKCLRYSPLILLVVVLVGLVH